DSTVDFNSFQIMDEIHFTAGGNTIRSSNGLFLAIGVTAPVNILSDSGTNTLDASLPLDFSVGAPSKLIQVTAGQLNINGDINGLTGSLIVSKMSAGIVVLGGRLNFDFVAGTNSVSVNGGTLFLTGNSPLDKGTTGAFNCTLVVNGYYPNSPV